MHVYGAQRLGGSCIHPLTASAALRRKALILLRVGCLLKVGFELPQRRLPALRGLSG
jgi:hypothetical protein